jgi:nucleoside-diphosphate-sugar epimerase
MKIVITGGSGRLGKYLTKEMKKEHEVKVFDILESKESGIIFEKGDILNIKACRKAFKGYDAVVHLAGIPDTWNDPPETVFRINTVGTFNVYQAASDLGIKKIVYASSETTYGFHFRNNKNILPVYLPFDEKHPLNPADAYGLSKMVGEEAALSFTKRYDISTVVIRICWIWIPEDVEEYKGVISDPSNWMSLWAYVDYRDAVQAFKLATERECGRKFDIFLIAADDNGTEVESRELVYRYYSERIPFTKEIAGRRSLYDSTKAKCLLGYSPRYSWKDLIKL